MKELAEDLAFSIPHMRRLQELGIRAMEVAEETAREEEASLARIRASLKDLPRGIDTSGMEQALDRVQGTLVSDLYGIAKDKLKYIIDDLAESIPRIDQECCKQMDEIGVRTEQIGLKVKAITEMLEDSNFNLPLDGYQRQMMNLLYNGQEVGDGFIPLSNVKILTTIEGMTADEKWELWKKRKTLGDKLETELDNWFKNHPWSDLDWRFTKEFNFEVDRADQKKDWIPETMQLDGTTEQEKYLKERIDGINANIQKTHLSQNEKDGLKWDQKKIDVVWSTCEVFDTKYGVQVDPRLLIAIIVKEGTGSFNTSSSNLAADGQNGVEVNFKSDLSKAVDLLGGKIVSYAYYKEDFSKAREEAYQKNVEGISDYDDILHYLNWGTPRLKINSKGFDTGVYARNNTWHRGVRDIYSNLVYENAPKDYTEYAISLGKEKIFEIADQYEITVKPIEFQAEKNGMDAYGEDTEDYTITGVIK